MRTIKEQLHGNTPNTTKRSNCMANYNTSNADSKHYQDTFYLIPRYIRHLPGITLAYLDIYETIFQFWNKNKDCYLGEEALCERTGYKRAVVYKALSFFEKHIELKRVKLNGKRYLVKPEKIIETDCLEEEQTSATVESNVYSRRLLTSTTVDHNIKNINKENKTTTEPPHLPQNAKSDYSGKRADNNQIKRLGREQEPNNDSITEALNVVVFESPNKDKFVLKKIKDAPKENKPEYSTVKFLKEIKYHIEKHYPDNFHHGVNAVAKLLRKHKWSTPAGYVDVDAENARKKEIERRYQEMLKAQEEMAARKRKELYSALKCAKNEMIKRPVATKAFSSAIKSMYDVLGARRMLKNTQSGGSVFAQAS